MAPPDILQSVTAAAYDLDVFRLVATLRFTRPARFHFHHAGPLMGVLCNAFQTHPLPRRFLPFACEAAHVAYEPGDRYRLGLTVIGRDPAGRDPVEALAEGLTRIGKASIHADVPPATLYGNFELDEITTHSREVGLQRHLDAVTRNTALNLRFLSPLRLERPLALQRQGARYMDAECFPANHFLIRLWARLFWLTHGGKATPDLRDAVARTLSPTMQTRDARLWWIDVPIKGRDGEQQGRAEGYTLGGVLGEITLDGIDGAWRDLLTAGQWLHAGGKIQFGFGRYVIDSTWDPQADPFMPACSHRERLSEPRELEAALDHVIGHSKSAGVDNLAPGDVSTEDPELVFRLSRELRSRTYRAAELLGIVQTKLDGRPRALVVPTVADRCVQRAAVQAMGKAIDILLEDCSYAYRKGFSRSHAAQAINRAYDQGYRYVLDADISAFYDSVSWELILAKLRAHFPLDDMSGLIASWLRAPVRYGGRTIARDRGLPQGAAISPLLANLLLDEFDEQMLTRNYRLVRYADDFVVLCRDLAEAQRAKEDAATLLARLGLELNERKTSITDFDAGFSYLGYLFVRSLVLEQKRPAPERGRSLEAGDIPAGSWLAQVPLERVQELQSPPGRSSVAGEALPRLVPLVEAKAPAARASTPLYILGHERDVRLDGELVVIEKEGAERVEVPVHTIMHMVVVGRSRLTVPVLLALARRGTPVFFCHRNGEIDTVINAPRPERRVWRAQEDRSEDQSFRLQFAKSIVRAKLHNQMRLAARFRFDGGAEATSKLRNYKRVVLEQSSVEAVVGYEGQGAVVFFGALRQSLTHEWAFNSRQRRPPRDPINAMLSFGYTIMYNHAVTAITAAGLDPRIGILHCGHGSHDALASDLVEEFRHMVDAHVWALVRRREIKPGDFGPSADGRYPCLMNSDARRRFLFGLERRLMTEFKPDPSMDPISYRAFMFRQATRLKGLLLGELVAYEPLMLHA